MITSKIGILRYLLMALLAIACLSCEKVTFNYPEVVQTVHNSRIEGNTVENPYSLRIMQAALDSLLLTKSGAADYESIVLEPTDYYIRICAIDTTAVEVLSALDVELFDYPLDCEFEDDAEYFFDPVEPVENQSGWFYTAVPVEYSSEEIPYQDVIDAQESGSYIKVDLDTGNDKLLSCDLIDKCYIPEHDLLTKSGDKLPVSPEELEAMAYVIAGVQQDDCMTKASSSYPCGYVYLNDGKSDRPVKGVKIRVQKFLKWRIVYTNASGYFSVSDKFKKPNISIMYNNTKDFTIWGNWLFLAPATYTITNCTTANSFQKTFKSKDSYSPWTWAVVNNATYDYYDNCSNTGILKGVSLPPSNMKLWCLNVNLGNVGGGAPMIKHLITSRVLSGTTAILAFMASINWVTVITTAVAAIINVMGPDILINTYNKTYNKLYATTFHELSHASHFSSIGEWNYGKLIWYEMTHGDNTNLYGTGGTGIEGEGFCEVSETYAFSIENYIRKSLLSESSPSSGQSRSYFFNKYVSTLSSLLINGTLTPGQIYSCMSSSTGDMNSLMTALCNKYPSKKTAIQTEMKNKGL
jgi:hypothetical protein